MICPRKQIVSIRVLHYNNAVSFITYDSIIYCKNKIGPFRV